MSTIDALLQEASDPQTAPERLEALSRSTEPQVAQAVAKNPNTPIEILLALAKKFPREFVENPVVDLLLLENPELLRRLTPDVAKDMLRSVALPESWYAILAGHSDQWVQCAVAVRPNISEGLLFDMAASQFENVREAIAQRKGLSAELYARCSARYSDKVYSALVKNPTIDKATVIRLLESPFRYIRMQAAKRSDAPPKTIERLRRAGATETLETYAAPTEPMTEDEVYELSRRGAFARRIAAGHPNASTALQRALFTSEDFETRGRLAGSSVVAIELLEALAKDPAQHVRAEVAKNRRTPRHTLASFNCSKEEGSVKDALVENPNLPRESFFLLVENPPRLARSFLENLQNNPSTPAEILERFAFSSLSELNGIAAKSPYTSPRLREIFSKAGLSDLMRFTPGSRAPLTDEERAFLMRGYRGKWLLLQDPSLPLQMLREIESQPERDEGFEIEYENRHSPGTPPLMHFIAEHPNTDEALFANLWSKHQKKSGVIYSLAQNPRTPPAILDAIIKSNAAYAGKALASNTSLSRAQKQTLFLLTDTKTRAALLDHSDADPDLLCQACGADEHSLRQRARRDPRTPKEFLTLLRRAGADDSLYWFQAPDLSVSTQELGELAKIQAIGGYLHEVIIRHPSCTDDVVKEVWFVRTREVSKERSFRFQHALASRSSLPASLRFAMKEPLLQEALQIFQQERPLPAAPILSNPKTISLPRLQEICSEYPIERVYCHPGKRVKEEEILFELQLDVINFEFPSPESGVIGQLFVDVGSEVTVGAALFVLYRTESPNPAPAPSLLVQKRQSLVAAWHMATRSEPIPTQLFLHQPLLDTPHYTALSLHGAIHQQNRPARFWTDGHEVLSGEGTIEKIIAREQLATHPGRVSAQKVARIVSAVQPEIFGAPLCTIREERAGLHPPILVREPQGVRWVFWARKSSQLICWCLWIEDGMMRHRALTKNEVHE